MRRPRKIRTALVALATLSGAAACLDFTPITSFPARGDDASQPAEASGPEAGSSRQSRCLACAAGESDAGGCPMEYAACLAIDACYSTAVCATGACLASIDTVAQCLPACEAEGGAGDPASPANAAFSALLSCVSTHCQSACLQ